MYTVYMYHTGRIGYLLWDFLRAVCGWLHWRDWGLRLSFWWASHWNLGAAQVFLVSFLHIHCHLVRPWENKYNQIKFPLAAPRESGTRSGRICSSYSRQPRKYTCDTSPSSGGTVGDNTKKALFGVQFFVLPYPFLSPTPSSRAGYGHTDSNVCLKNR